MDGEGRAGDSFNPRFKYFVIMDHFVTTPNIENGFASRIDILQIDI